MKKKLLSLLLAAVMTVGMTACGGVKGRSTSSSSGSASGSKKTAAATTENHDTDVLNLNIASEPQSVDPALSISIDGGILIVNSFAGLYTYDQKQKLVPDIADGMPQVSSDKTEYTIKLKKTKWSNGEALTAKDFLYSWNRVIEKKTASGYAYLFDIIARKDGKLDVSAPDDYTLKIKLTNPCPYFNDLLAFPTFFPVYQKEVEKSVTKKVPAGTWSQEAGFVSNGAYILKSWKHNESMVYEKNPNFHDASKVKIKSLHFMLSAQDTTTYAAYNKGDLDFIDTVPNDEIKTVKNSKEFHIMDNLGTYYLAFNVNADLFKNMTEQQAKDFRHAIALLIDRQYIIDTVGQTEQVAADSYIPAGMSDGNGGEFKNKSYYDAKKTGQDSVEEAKKLLEGCGYKFSKQSDGTYKCSPDISFQYILNDDSGHKKIAQAVQQDLQALGINMQIQTEDWKVLIADRQNGNFTFAREGWLADYNDPINMLEMFQTKSGNNDPQFGKDMSKHKSAPQNWKDYDKLIDKIRTSTDFSSRVDLMHQAEDMLMDTWAVIPIYYYNDIYMQKQNVKGVFGTVYGFKYFMYATKS
ncbi:MAG: peptide ABC transporter substrate-binding protein [Lachnospiraceae bacterium]|uniref:Peptide ABC transporter substrate-binding protein n=1 Tax=Candidatus Weimeria bifida TaxID=2599074 RepID=A0A6N7J128_9FIRM|nr:peptide ABC transporter substrate-binding protein [Candidatus Weimeria bifida]RRF97321.1 MAG: peptide ABC transporter substrate-binding protein [Lachnospiraceae bacterium]